MINRICISINNRCNLRCKYCHFHEKGEFPDVPMDVGLILSHVQDYIDHNRIPKFHIGFVGNGEAFLDFDKLKQYVRCIKDTPQIHAYTITNGTVDLPEDDWRFLDDHKVKVGLSVDGPRELHNLYRCGSFDRAMQTAEHFQAITGHYPTWNATVGRESLTHAKDVIEFFRPFQTRVTFSRMIGRYGISLDEYRSFMNQAEQAGLDVRRGGTDCTMYGGRCGAGINNFFFANNKVYLCGNCIDLPPIADADVSLFELERNAKDLPFDRQYCFKETFVERDLQARKGELLG